MRFLLGEKERGRRAVSEIVAKSPKAKPADARARVPDLRKRSWRDRVGDEGLEPPTYTV
jgi:hypothetical protein